MELSPSICENAALDRVIRAWHLSAQLTSALESALEFSHGGGHHLVLSRKYKQLLCSAWLEQTTGAHENDWPRVIVCGQNIRRHVHRALASTDAMLTVLTEQEIRPDFELEILGTIDAVLPSDDTTSRGTLTD
jgi:flagellar biosynthesis component FlhA